MDNRDEFASASLEQPSAVRHQREAAWFRYLAMAATTQKVRRDLERRALVHDRLAGNLLRISDVGRTG
jgi:hypothetical protein